MTTNSVKELINSRNKTRILVKSREELQKILDEFCLTYKDGFSESGICSEKAIRESTGYRYDLFAGRELDAEKTFYDRRLRRVMLREAGGSKARSGFRFFG